MIDQNKIFHTVQAGKMFPIISMKALSGVSENVTLEIELSEIKSKIKVYLKSHKGAYISDLATELNVSPRKVSQAIKELKDEGIITVE